jgi:DNA (cytosine-5)-methyltransferase 1
MNLRVGSLFTGYGGLDIAVGGELAWYAEIEPAACKVLANHYPGVPNLGDITKIDWSEVEPVDVITGGYPCQPFSHAGNRKGKNDVRHLWPNVLDAIRAIRPRYAILENVSGHLTLGFADVLADLAEVGLSAQWGTFRASDVGAPHRRERIFIIAHTNGERSQGRIIGAEDAIRAGSRGAASDDCRIVSANTNNSGWLENVEQSSDIAATSGQGQPSVIDRSGADRDVATGSGALVAANTSGERHESRQRSGSIVTASDTNINGRRVSGDKASKPPTKRHRHDGESISTSAADTESTSKGRDIQQRGLSPQSRGSVGAAAATNWGKYAAAIQRWEAVLDRPAPAPTTPGRNERPRLNPQFVEWMMGLPEGWVTGHGLSAAQELKMLGNGVVPQQAHAAITQLLERTQP